jgi:hypothetical protein
MISKWVFPEIEKTTVMRRLRRLEEGEFIRRRGTFRDGSAVFLIGIEGARHLGQKVPHTTYPLFLLDHEFAINKVRWKLNELGLIRSWMTERELRSAILQRNPRRERSNLVIPDALILFRHFLAPNAKVELEVELHEKASNRYAARFKKFHQSMQKSQAFQWYVVRSEGCGLAILHSAARYGGVSIKDFIGFTQIDELIEKGLESRLFTLKQTLPLHAVLNEKLPAQEGAQGQGIPKSQNSESIAA